MKYKFEVTVFFLLFTAVMLGIILYSFGIKSAVLNPKGIIALKEMNLMNQALILMLIVVVPVFALTFFVCMRYSANNKKATYNPDWNHSYLAETVWWGFPLLIIGVLSYITWVSSHDLDPYKKLDSETKPLKIQAVALQWKWLFIYPEEQIASVNFLQFPVNRPLNFEITADAPMNSLWIPQLGGQIYAMPGMRSELHLIADEAGEYRGSSANLSGTGFAGMSFIAKAGSEEEFKDWVESAKKSASNLTLPTYTELAHPSENVASIIYNLKDPQLFEQIIMKFMTPGASKPDG